MNKPKPSRRPILTITLTGPPASGKTVMAAELRAMRAACRRRFGISFRIVEKQT